MNNFLDKDSGTKNFVCPSDRQLSLRAKLQTGWSSSGKRTALNSDEQELIVSVIKRNEQLEMAERQRVGKLVERVERIKQRASYYGPKNCSLCGSSFGLGILFNMSQKLICDDCKKPVCSHCCAEIPSNSPVKKEICLCHVCSEIRDVWKKTGAWFYKGLPNYELPNHTTAANTPAIETPPRIIRTTKLGMEIDESDDDDDDDDDQDCMDNTNNKNVSDYIKQGSFTRSLLNNKNLFNLRLTNGNNLSSRISSDELSLLPKKSPISPYSRQTSSTDSQKSAISSSSQNHDWDAATSMQNRQRRSSISSSYSVTELGNNSLGVNQIFREPIVLGWLEVNFNYEESQNTLDCTVIRARDLPAMDSAGLADPFCKLNIITPENVLRSSRWLKTKVVHKTNNPEFNETLTFIGMSVEDVANSALYVVLLDDDKYGNDFLGATKMSLAPLQNCSPCRMSVPLGPEDKFSIESISNGWPNGQILIALCYNTQRRALTVVIKRCINLLAMDKNGFSDPFVKIQLRPDSHRKKYKTSIKWRNLNPVFNEEFFFETRPNELDKQALTITVWDKDLGKSNDFLGSLILGQNSKGRRLKQWKDCIRLPDQYHEQWHCLSCEMPNNH